MAKPKISVVMISNNHEKYIEEAVSSILGQTFSDFELIIVDDGSIDDTYFKLEKFSDNRVIKIKQDKSGTNVAINNGLARSRGDYFALMSGDQTSVPTRLETQIKQLETNNLDIVFSVPAIIGPKSEQLPDSVCPWFYYKSLENLDRIYRKLFFKENFLLATSLFARCDAMIEIGDFHPGLIQMYDYDYWIRACKKRKKIQLFQQRLVNYRHLTGSHFSPESFINWASVGTKIIYKDFFKNCPQDILIQAFGDIFADIDIEDELDLDIALSFLYFLHNERTVKEIGLERLIDYLYRSEYHEKLSQKFQFRPSDILRVSEEIFKVEPSLPSRVFEFMTQLFQYGQSIAGLGFRMSEENMEKQINTYLSKADFNRASNLIKTRNIIIDGLSWRVVFSNFIRKLKVNLKEEQPNSQISQADFSSTSNLSRSKNIFVNGISLRSFFSSIIAKVKRRVLIIHKQLSKLIMYLHSKFVPRALMLLNLHKLLDYSLENKLLFYKEPPEIVSITLPPIFGTYSTELEEGNAMCPPAYISIVPNSFVTGGAGLVLTKDNKILSDEMVEFSGKEYGIKSTNILYRDGNKLLFENKSNSYLSIPEGIMLLTDHDTNYFHWIIEVLPKLLFINTFPEFRNLPVLITADLHENLEDLLSRLNITNRRIIRLKSGKLYKVLRLVIPSSLSRINDRYLGKTIFDQDIVLSDKWISKVSKSLQRIPEKKPWRKIYIKRNPDGFRVLKNSLEIEQYLVEQGFEVISLENASIDYQLDLFSQAALVVTTSGAALTNILFCQPGTTVIVFMVDTESSNYYFWNSLGKIANVDVELIIGKRAHKLRDRYAIHDDFYLPLELLKQRIEYATNRIG